MKHDTAFMYNIDRPCVEPFHQ